MIDENGNKYKICIDPNCPHHGERQYEDLDGFNGKYCRECTNRRRRENYENNKEHYREQKRRSLKNTATVVKERKKKYYDSKLKFESRLTTRLSKYEEIRQDPDNPEFAQVKCTYHDCKTIWFTPTVMQASNRLKAINNGIGELRFYCSDKCKNKCPIYWQKDDKKILAEIDPESLDEEMLLAEVDPEFREMVFKRDNYTCCECGRSKEDFPDIVLQCHHIEPKTINPMMACDLDNAKTLCFECHLKVHQKDGCKYHQLRRDFC